MIDTYFFFLGLYMLFYFYSTDYMCHKIVIALPGFIKTFEKIIFTQIIVWGGGVK